VTILFFSEQQDLALELVSEAKRLSSGNQDKVIGVVPDRETAEKAIKLGADKVCVLPKIAGVPLASCSEALVKVIKDENPKLILVGGTRTGKEIAACAAAILDIGCVSDVQEIKQENENFSFRRMMYGGLATAWLESRGSAIIATVPPYTFEQGVMEERTGEITDFPQYGSDRIKVVEVREKGEDSVNIKDAKLVVGVGRGWASQDDLKLAFQLAEALKGEVGCSRPVAEDLHWLPEERYIGISGQVIKPNLYLATGISGQVQHISGIRDAKVIFAIDKNENAPIFQMADYYIVGDLYQIIPALLKELGR
jgi:electron transfer flavoprotein alpha subunit